MKREVAEKFLRDNIKIPHQVLGSFGRGVKQKIKDIDIMVLDEYRDFWRDLPYDREIKIDGHEHALVHFYVDKEVVPLDVFYYQDGEQGCFKAYLAGSKWFNIAMRTIAKKRGYTLNQKYVRDLHTGNHIYFDNEKELLEFFGYEFVPYEEREVSGIPEAFKVLKKYKKEVL